MDELDVAQVGDVEAGEQRELLEADRPLAPRPRLAHGEAAVVVRDRRLERRPPVAQVVAVQEAAALAREAVDLLCDEPLVEDAARALDLFLARAAARLVEQARPRGGELRVAKRRAGPWGRKVEVGRARPFAQQRLDALDDRSDPGDDGVPVLRVADREAEHVLETPRPELLEQQEPAAECARDAGGEQPRSRHQLVAEPANPLDRRVRGSDALRAEDDGLATRRRPEDRRQVSSRSVEMRLDDLEREPRRHGRVEGVAAALEDGHAHARREPVCRRDGTEAAPQLRPRGERHHDLSSAASISFASSRARVTRWHATKCPSPTSTSGGCSSCDRGADCGSSGQRVRKRQPEGGVTGDGMSPSSTTRVRVR